MELIMPGNKNLNTVRNVVFFAKKLFSRNNKIIQKVCYIDVEESPDIVCGVNVDEFRIIEKNRSEIIRKYLGKVKSETVPVLFLKIF